MMSVFDASAWTLQFAHDARAADVAIDAKGQFLSLATLDPISV
jgi:hypothetical protein